MNLLIQMTATAVKPIEVLQIFRMDMANTHAHIAMICWSPLMVMIILLRFSQHRFYYADRNKQNIDK